MSSDEFIELDKLVDALETVLAAVRGRVSDNSVRASPRIAADVPELKSVDLADTEVPVLLKPTLSVVLITVGSEL